MTEKESLPISVMIPTKNEIRNLPSTLDSLSDFGEIIILDSFSTDGTQDYARSRGCPVHERKFDYFARHKNWGLDNIPFRYDWVLILDADEKIEPSLQKELEDILRQDEPCDGYYIPRQIIVDGVWLKHAGKWPDWQLRFFKKGQARYEPRLVHEHMEVEGKTGYLKTPLRHLDAKGVWRYNDRHNNYAEMEAVEAFILQQAAPDFSSLMAQLRQGGPARRRALKSFAYRFVPLRPFIVFFYLYFVRLGFIMGRAGIKTCALRFVYEYFIDLFLEEMQDPEGPTRRKYANYIKERLENTDSEARI